MCNTLNNWTDWAILSGIQGNLTAYEAVLADINARKFVEIYILGDVVGPTPNSEKIVQTRSPHRNEIKPMICKGWWKNNVWFCIACATSEPSDLIRKYGANAVKLLDSVSRTTVEMETLILVFEFDSLLIHV